MTIFWSGPYTTSLLGAMGAQVIKVESVQRPDGARHAMVMPQHKGYERAPLWNGVNLNKLGITLNLTDPRGVALFKRLAALADVVIENFSPRVLSNLGLDYEKLREINERLILVRMPSFGVTGPWRDYVGYALTFDQVGGLAYLNGHQGMAPRDPSGVADPLAGLYGTMATILALEHRRKTGRGQLIDLSQCEAMATLCGEAVLDCSVNGTVQSRMGNRDKSSAPHGCYPCSGADSWVAISVTTDDEWRNFCQALDRPSWAKHPDFATPSGRWRNQERLDGFIGEWTKKRDKHAVMHLLQGAGVPAGIVADGRDLMDNPQLKERGFFSELDREVIGKRDYAGWAPRLSKTPIAQRFAGPILGEHNRYLLGELLGLSAQELDSLEADDVIGSTPLYLGEEAGGPGPGFEGKQTGLPSPDRLLGPAGPSPASSGRAPTTDC